MRTSLDIQQGQLQMPISRRDHTIGSPDAPVTLVEFGDYQCPYCGAAHPVVSELLKKRASALIFAFRHFPLTNVHENAQFAAESAEAAGAQGQYWEMHSWLFEHQRQLQPSAVMAAAAAIGLDIDRFAQDLVAHSFLPKVQEDFMTGLRSGVNGTPTFFINGARYDGPATLEALTEVVDEFR